MMANPDQDAHDGPAAQARVDSTDDMRARTVEYGNRETNDSPWAHA
jgi:hypothetical protein